MTDKSISRRYAKALFSIGEEQGKIKAFSENLQDFLAVLESNEGLAATLNSYFISNTEKKNVVRATFSSYEPLVINFICLVLDKGRGLYLREICNAYQRLQDDSENILHAIVKSVIPLTEEQKKELEEKFSSLTSQKVKVELSVDPSLIGGLMVRVGDKIYDGTLARQLELMRESLKESKLG